MPEPPEKFYYTPEEFGDLFHTTPQSQPEQSSFDVSPESMMRLLHGQHPTLNAYVDIMRRDRLLSAFPDPQEGARLLETVLPTFLQLCTPQDQSSLPSMKPEQVFNRLLFDLFTGDEDQIEAGGQEMMYISVNQPPVEQTYEYIGEKLLRSLRKQFHHDTDLKTQAFFGWIGRRLMKKVCPETDFSLDRHMELTAKERVEIADAFVAFRNRLNEGVEENLTEDKVKVFFKELNGLADALPSMIDGYTPMRLRVGNNLGMNFNGGDDLDDYLPYKYDTPRIFHDNTFAKFMEDWQSAPREGQFPYNFRQSYKKLHPEIFCDIPEDDTVARQLPVEVLLPKWFTMMTTILLNETEWIAKDAQDFTVSYFRFIRNKDVAAGYAFAEKHISEIFMHLPQMFSMTEEVISARFLAGNPHILYDKYDYGQNSTDDMYSDIDFEAVEIPACNEKERVPPIILSEKELSRTDEEWLNVIGHGPNAALYEELQAINFFSHEDWILGVDPLFFGNWLSDREANLLYKTEEQDIFYEKRRAMVPIERERERIQELKTGKFTLPITHKDLIHNATRQIQRLELQYDELRDKATTFNVNAIQKACFLKERILSLQKVQKVLYHIYKE